MFVSSCFSSGASYDLFPVSVNGDFYGMDPTSGVDLEFTATTQNNSGNEGIYRVKVTIEENGRDYKMIFHQPELIVPFGLLIELDLNKIDNESSNILTGTAGKLFGNTFDNYIQSVNKNSDLKFIKGVLIKIINKNSDSVHSNIISTAENESGLEMIFVSNGITENIAITSTDKNVTRDTIILITKYTK